MKVEAEKVKEFLRVQMLLLNGIVDTIRCGDDGFQESVYDQVKDMQRMAEEFRTVYLVKREEVQEPEYEAGSVPERMYAFMWRVMKKEVDTELLFKPDRDIVAFVEGKIVESQGWIIDAYFNHFVATGSKMMEKAFNVIIERRKKEKQPTLFDQCQQ
jgi:hypothetical protein